MWLEVWTRPGDSSFAKRIDDLPALDQSWTRRPNGVGEGTAVLPDTYDRFDEILTSDPDTPANDVSSLIRVYRGSTLLYEWIPLEIVPSEGTDDPRVEVKGAGIEAILGYARVEPWDWDGTDDFTSLFPDWIWGGRNLLGELGSRYIPHEVEVTLNYADAGTFTLSVTTDAGSDTTGNIAYDATANAVDVALTALSNLTFPDVEGETPSWTIRFSDETQTLTVTGDASNLDGAWQICVTGASGGTYTVTIDGNTSGTIAFDATAAVVETAIEAVTGITAASVERVSVTDGFCWNVFFDTPTSVSTFTINDTGLTGAGSEVGSVTQFTPTITIDTIQQGSIVPAGWEVSRSYLSDLPHGTVEGFRMWRTGDPALPAGCTTAIRFDGGEPYFPGIQKVVRVTPGSRVQASAKILSEGSGETVRLVVRDLAEQEIGGAGQARDEQTLVADTWTNFSIADIDIPDNVSEVIFRIGHVGTGDPVPIWTACPVLSEGLQATTVGGIFDALYDDAVSNHSATRVVWDDGGGTPYLTLDFTAVLDSAGAAWSDSEVSMTVKRGQSYLRVLQEFARLGYEWQLVPNSITAGTWKLQLFNTGNLGTVHTGSDSPTIQGGRDVVRREVRRFLPEFTDYSVEGDEQKSSRARNTAAVTALGRIEGYLPNVDLSSTEAASVAAQAVTQTLARSKSLVYTVTPGDLHPVPGIDYVVGDILNVLDPPEVPKQERRVMAITGLDGSEGERFRVSLGSESFIGVGAIYEGVRQLLAEFDAIRRDPPEGAERLGTAGAGSDGGSAGAYIHLSRSASQEIPVNGAAVEWDTVSTLIPPANFTVVPPSTDITVAVGGYYDLGIMLGWSSFTDGGSVWVTRTRGSELTVWPPTDDPGIWTSTDGQLFEATAKGIPCQPGDILRVYVDADDASPQTLASATVTVELIDRVAEAEGRLIPGAIVVATGTETSPTVTAADEMTVEADLTSVTDPIEDLMAIIRVHERSDGAASSVPTDQWGPGEAYFTRTANDGDTASAPDKLRIQMHRHFGVNTGYTVKVDWAVFSKATSATITSGQKSTTASGTPEYEFTIPVSTTVGMQDIVPLVRVHQGRDGFDDALAAPVWVVADAMFTRSDGDTTATLPPEHFTFRVYVESGTPSGTVYVDYLLLDGTQGGLLESAETAAASTTGRTSGSSYREWDFTTPPTSGQGDLLLWIRSHENLDGAAALGTEYIRPANYLFDNDPDDTGTTAVPDGVAMFWAGDTGTNYRHTAYALSKTAEITAP